MQQSNNAQCFYLVHVRLFCPIMAYLKLSSILVAVVLVCSATIFAALMASVYAAVNPTINGKATSCSGVINCSFALTNASGTGSASTSGFVGGYVGQNLTFYGGSVTFRLPGELTTTYASGVYNGKALVSGFSSTAGTLYHVTGSFKATDANNGKIVSGSTNVLVGVKGHSGRGGGIYWTLVSGSITLTQLNIDGTTTSVACAPSTIASGASATCSAAVTDLNKLSGTVPTGTVTFYASNIGLGSFSKSSCGLSTTTGSCSVNFVSNAEYGGGTTSIYSSYSGDSLHSASSARTVLYVTAPIDSSGTD